MKELNLPHERPEPHLTWRAPDIGLPEAETWLSVEEPADLERFQKLLAELSHQFATVSLRPGNDAIGEAQVRVCEALGLDCCALLRNKSAGADMTVAFSWSGGKAPQGFRFSPLEQCPGINEDLSGSQTVGLEAVAEGLIGSAMILPMIVGNTRFGALAFGAVGWKREWEEVLEANLRAVTDLFANVLARTEAEEEVQALRAKLGQLSRSAADSLQVRESVRIDQQYANIIGKSPAIGRVISQAEQVAGTEAIVLLTGETGTGKELVAQLIHDLSLRRGKPMVKVNCAALPPNLVESELFGRERGAYTGALTREVGRFEFANQSTIFLDELAELPLELQAKLLRVLQDGMFERVGSPKPIRTNVRVIAATNRDLKREMSEGRFREDLFYRLNVFPIEIPPLRERPEDIPMLAWAFVGEFGNAMGKTIEAIPQASIEALQRYSWPGNVRELRNVIERAMIVSNGPTLRVAVPSASGVAPDKGTLLNLRDLERQHILEVMRQTRWRVRGAGGAAELLGLKPTTLEARMAKLGISRNNAPVPDRAKPGSPPGNAF